MRAWTLACIWMLVPSVSSAVRIVNSESRPVSGAVVTMTLAGDWEAALVPAAELSGRTDEHGALPFRIPSVSGVTLVVDHPSFAPAVFERGNEGTKADLRLERGVVWHGRVVAASGAGQPLDGEVCAGGWVAAKRRWRRCGSVQSGGFFELEGLPPGSLDVDVRVDGFLPRIETLDPQQTSTLYLTRGLLLRGVVTDARKKPVRGAAIKAGRARARSGKEGRFSVAVETLPVTLEVRMAGFRRWTNEVVRDVDVNVRLVPAERISGVLVAEDGAPVRSVALDIAQSFGDGRRESIRSTLETGEKGDFVFDLPEPGRYSIAFHAPGYHEVRLSELEVGNGAILPVGFVSLRRGAGVRAVVADGPTGQALHGALVEVLPAGALLLQTMGQRSIPTAVTDEAGAFTVSGFDIGRYLVRIRRASSAAVHHLVDLLSSEIVDLGSITLDRGVEIYGRVIGPDSEAVHGVSVRLFDPAREMIEPLARTATGADGRFNLRVSPARYRVEVGGERLLLAQEIVVPATESKVELALRAGGVRIRGRVTRAGLPVSGGTIQVVSALDPASRRGKIVMQRDGKSLIWGLPQTSVATGVDAEGWFVLNGGPVGLVRVWYVGVNGEAIVRSAVLPDGDAEVLMPLELQGHAIEGRLIDGSTRGGVPGTVRLFDAEGRSLTDSQASVDGAFRFGDLQRGTYSIDARAPGYLPASSRTIDVGDETLPQTLELSAGESGRIGVALTRVDKSGANGVPVTVFDLHGALVQSLPTHTSGRRDFDDLPPGEYVVAWADPFAGAGCSSSVRVGAFRAPAVSATLQRGASIVVACPHHRCAGQPIQLLEIIHSGGLEMSPLLSGISPALHFSEDGEVSIGRLAPGRYLFRLWAGDQRWEKDVTVGSRDQRVVFQ